MRSLAYTYTRTLLIYTYIDIQNKHKPNIHQGQYVVSQSCYKLYKDKGQGIYIYALNKKSKFIEVLSHDSQLPLLDHDRGFYVQNLKVHC